MKPLFYRLILLVALAGATGCERELMDFGGRDAIYFDVQRGAAWVDSAKWVRYYYTEINFIKIPQDTITIDLKVAIEGEVTDYPRPFSIEVLTDSTTAVEGKDFDIRREWEMPAHAAYTYIRMNAYKQQDLLDTNRIIMLRVKENEYFKTDMSFTGSLPGRGDLIGEEIKFNPDPRFHTINLTFQVAKPSSWYGIDYPKTEDNPNPYELGIWGGFSVKKYLVIMQVTGLTDEDFNKDVPSGMATAIGEKVAKYLEEQFDKGEPVLENDGRLMWVSAVKKWSSYQYEW